MSAELSYQQLAGCASEKVASVAGEAQGDGGPEAGEGSKYQLFRDPIGHREETIVENSLEGFKSKSDLI